jgi:hypothetical protein
MPRITALHMLRSTISTVSAPASSSFRGSLPHPTPPLCTLRVRRHRRLTQHSLPGGLLGLTWAGLAPADRASFAGAFAYSITASVIASSDGGIVRSSALAVLRLTLVRTWSAPEREDGRLLALQYAIDVAGPAPKLVDRIRRVGYQTAVGDHVTPRIDRRQLVPRCKRDDHTPTRRIRSPLCARRKRPCRRRAAERDNEISPPDVDCHVTLPRGRAQCNRGNNITL